MKTKIYFFALSVCLGFVATSCIDENYDLSDIDTTTQLKVRDLTIPVNLKDVQLESIISVDDNDPNATIQIAELNGKKVYAISKTGTFEAKPSTIEKLHAPSPDDLENTVETIKGFPHRFDQVKGRRVKAKEAMRYVITPQKTSFTFNVGSEKGIDDAIKSVSDIGFAQSDPIHLSIKLSSDNIKEYADNVSVSNLVLTLPEGMEVRFGNIESSNGKLTISELDSSTDNLDFELISSNFNLDEIKDGSFDVKDNEMKFSSEIGIESGDFFVYPKSGKSVEDMPKEIDFKASYDMSGFTASTFSGEIEYKTEVNPMKAIDLSELPDFLAGDETNLILENPQLYLYVNNPLADYNVFARSGLTLTAKRDNGNERVESLSQFEIGQKTDNGEYGILIASHPDSEDVKSDFKNSSKYEFKGLSNILSGNGLPNHIDIELASKENPDPEIYGNAKNFPLGEKISNIEGRYEFFTPFALANGSTIVYKKAIDGWNSGDVDAIEISDLTVSALVTTDIPAGITLIAWPLDKNGNKIEECKAEASVTAGCTAEPLVFTMKGDIRHLDGIFIEAIAKDFNGKALSPEQYIQLTDIRAKISGSYTKKF